jgi:cysteine-rich repeat protein
MGRRGKVKLGLAALALPLLIGPAQATFHLMSIVEVFAGTPAAPQAQYVVLQMYAQGQNLVADHNVTLYDAAGTVIGNVVFGTDTTNPNNQSKILIATPQAATFFGLFADLEISPQIMAAGGKVCFANTIDCVAWGNYTGSPSGVGTPFNAAGGISPGRAAVRRLDISGGANTLDAGDDTDNCAADFAFGTPAPRNSANMLGAAPSATCGNGSVEGLEQCDDGNTANGDSCNSTCSVATQPTYRAPFDFNGDARSDVAWRNTQTGANSIWRSANAATAQAVTGVTNLSWEIVGIGDFDNSGQADLLWRNASTGANAIWRAANAASQQAIAAVPATSWKIVGVGDFDNDARADIVWRNEVSGANALWRSGNSATATALASVTNQQWRVVGVGDFNGDDRDDLLWRNVSTGANAIWRSGNYATAQAVTTVATSWSVVGVGDFNNDNADDILWRNAGTGANSIWRSASTATAGAITPVSGNAWRVEAIADYDGDGRDDILWRNATTGANSIWRSGNSGTPQAMAGVASQAWQIVP